MATPKDTREIVLREMVERSGIPPNRMGLRELRAWLDRTVSRALLNDGYFRESVAMWRIRRDNAHVLVPAKESLLRARAAYEGTTDSVEIAKLQKAAEKLRLTVEGTTKFLETTKTTTAAKDDGDTHKRDSAAQKLEQAKAAYEAALTELTAKERACSALMGLREREAEVERILEATGITAAEKRLSERKKGTSDAQRVTGGNLEDRATRLWRDTVLPSLPPLPAALALTTGGERETVALQNVKLGVSNMELDIVLVDAPKLAAGSEDAAVGVVVLGIVEVKQNLNDLGSSFQQHQKSLAWLTGDTAHYSPADFKNKHFPRGHFDTTAVHANVDPDSKQRRRFEFTRESFRLFTRDEATGMFLDRLFFAAPELRPDERFSWLHSGDAASLLFHLARDEPHSHILQPADGSVESLRLFGYDFDHPDATPDDAIERVRLWLGLRIQPGELAASDVLLMYCDRSLADHIVFIPK